MKARTACAVGHVVRALFMKLKGICCFACRYEIGALFAMQQQCVRDYLRRVSL